MSSDIAPATSLEAVSANNLGTAAIAVGEEAVFATTRCACGFLISTLDLYCPNCNMDYPSGNGPEAYYEARRIGEALPRVGIFSVGAISLAVTLVTVVCLIVFRGKRPVEDWILFPLWAGALLGVIVSVGYART